VASISWTFWGWYFVFLIYPTCYTWLVYCILLSTNTATIIIKDEIGPAPNYTFPYSPVITCLLGHVVFTILNSEIPRSPNNKYHTHHYQQPHILDHSTFSVFMFRICHSITFWVFLLPFSLYSSSLYKMWFRVELHKFSKNLGATSKFQVRESCHEEYSIPVLHQR